MSALFSCREAVRLATEAMEHPLSFRQRLSMRVHLVLCSACRAYRRQVRSIELLIRRKYRQDITAPGDGLSTEARARMSAALRLATRSNGSPP